MTLSLPHIEFGSINAVLWVILFFATLAYEWATVVATRRIVQLKSIAVANISVLLNVIGMLSVVAYTQELNCVIPILIAVWVGNFLGVELEKRKEKKK